MIVVPYLATAYRSNYCQQTVGLEREQLVIKLLKSTSLTHSIDFKRYVMEDLSVALIAP